MGGSYALGWIGNMERIIATALSTQLSLHVSRFAKPAVGAPTFQTAGGAINTGATLSDFSHYYLLAQAAYIKALTA